MPYVSSAKRANLYCVDRKLSRYPNWLFALNPASNSQKTPMRRITPFSLLILLSVLILFPHSSSAQVETGHIVEQNGCPLLIDEFQANGLSNRISFEIKGRNIKRSDIVATQFAVFSFTPFGKTLHASTWTEVERAEPISTGGSPLEASFYFPTDQTNRHFESVVYVHQLRMEDGRIWKPNIDSVRAEIRSIIEGPSLKLPNPAEESLARDTTSESI